MYKRKWKPNKKQKEAFKAKLEQQDQQLQELKEKYNDKIVNIYWNDNKSSLYVYLKNGNSYRISTHHLPNRNILNDNKYRDCIIVDNEVITNSRDNIIKKAIEILEVANN